MRTAALLLVLALLAALPATVAAKGGKATQTGAFSRVMIVDGNANGLPDWSDTISWNVSASVPLPWVFMTCSQNGTPVLYSNAGYYDSYPWSRNMELRSGVWTGGPASCSATLQYTDGRRWYVLATSTFAVGA